MSDFKAKMYLIQFRLELRPRSRWRSVQRSPRSPIGGLRGLLLRGWEGNGEGRGGDGREGKGRESLGEERGRERTPHAPPNPYFWIRPCLCWIVDLTVSRPLVDCLAYFVLQCSSYEPRCDIADGINYQLYVRPDVGSLLATWYSRLWKPRLTDNLRCSQSCCHVIAVNRF